MELRQLRHVVAVADTLHFGKAAERLNMTQPPLSQSIMAIEDELGVRLFERTKRRVVLTEIGSQWVSHARKVVDSVAELPGIARRLSIGEMGRLRLSFVSTTGYSIFPALISGYRKAFPAVDLELTEATSDVQVEALVERRIDVGIVIASSRAAMPPGVSYRPLLSEPLIAAVPQTWLDDGGLEHDAPPTILVQPLIIFPRRSAPGLHDAVLDIYRREGMAPNIIQEAIQMQTIIGLVASGMGMSIVPQSMENLQRPGVRYIPMRSHVPRIETGLIWRETDDNPALVNFLLHAAVVEGLRTKDRIG
ncbi:LysR family transcriptional regulator [Paramesorhizobium deserti]|uniref:LysR family transcriptional regulator n=1 Tax=Paramesorhizobium deserti TaxID=1494590 RepID=A0A135HXB9_9HYPH|nr:LysR family transcriptional regulator [Paramesorhizobium deserti]KXF77850.1 LysR family transcriptional regulator [Paramesorhizobium deserti]